MAAVGGSAVAAVLGSSASRSPSPIRFTLITVADSNRPGPATNHTLSEIRSLASSSNLPQVGSSSGKPRPRKDTADSVRIARAIPSVADTMTWLTMFGRMCLMINTDDRVPIDRLASTNSSSLIDRTSPRTIRAVDIQLVPPMMPTIRMKMPRLSPKRSWTGSRNSTTCLLYTSDAADE